MRVDVPSALPPEYQSQEQLPQPQQHGQLDQHDAMYQEEEEDGYAAARAIGSPSSLLQHQQQGGVYHHLHQYSQDSTNSAFPPPPPPFVPGPAPGATRMMPSTSLPISVSDAGSSPSPSNSPETNRSPPGSSSGASPLHTTAAQQQQALAQRGPLAIPQQVAVAAGAHRSMSPISNYAWPRAALRSAGGTAGSMMNENASGEGQSFWQEGGAGAQYHPHDNELLSTNANATGYRRGSEHTITGTGAAAAAGGSASGAGGGLQFDTAGARPDSADEVEGVAFGDLQIGNAPLRAQRNDVHDGSSGGHMFMNDSRVPYHQRTDSNASSATALSNGNGGIYPSAFQHARGDSQSISSSAGEGEGQRSGSSQGGAPESPNGILMSSAASIATYATDEQSKPPSYYSRTDGSDGTTGRPSPSPTSAIIPLPGMQAGSSGSRNAAGPSAVRDDGSGDAAAYGFGSARAPTYSTQMDEGESSSRPAQSTQKRPREKPRHPYGMIDPEYRELPDGTFELRDRADLPGYRRPSPDGNGATPPARYASLPRTAAGVPITVRPITADSFRAGGYQQGRIALQAQEEADLYTSEYHHGLPGAEPAPTEGATSSAGSRESLLIGNEGYEFDGEVPVPRPHLKTMFYGLDGDLRTRLERKCPISPEFIVHGHVKKEEESIKTFTPNFSVEMAAKSFDEKDRPVFAGRAPLMRGIVRVPADPNKHLVIRVTAFSSALTKNPTWEAPDRSAVVKHGERVIFETIDLFDPRAYRMFSVPPPVDPKTGLSDPTWQPTDKVKDFYNSIPFDINFPVGLAQVYKDGKHIHQPTPLPPTYEAADCEFEDAYEEPQNDPTLEMDQEQKEPPSASKRALEVMKGVVRLGPEIPPKIGVWYYMLFEWRDGNVSRDGKMAPWRSKGKNRANAIKIPINFLGEPSDMESGATLLPPSLPPQLLLKPGTPIGPGWKCHVAKTRWAKANFTVFKRDLRIELHLPNPPNFFIPSLIPFLIVLRPQDPKQLPSLEDEDVQEILNSTSITGSPMQSFADLKTAGSQSSVDLISQEEAAIADINAKAASILEKYDNPLHARSAKSVSHWFRSNLGLKPKGKGKMDSTEAGESSATPKIPERPVTSSGSLLSGAGTLSSVAHSTAPSVMTISMVHDICSYIKVSMVQMLLSEEANVNTTPAVRKRVVATADLEEVDVSTLFNPEYGNPYSEKSGTWGTSADVEEAIARAKKGGWRVIQGMMRIGPEHPAGFKSHGVAVKYAVKLDLLPFSKIVRRTVAEAVSQASSPDSVSTASFGTVRARSPSANGTLAGRGPTAAGLTNAGSSLDLSLSPAFNSEAFAMNSPKSVHGRSPAPKRSMSGFETLNDSSTRLAGKGEDYDDDPANVKSPSSVGPSGSLKWSANTRPPPRLSTAATRGRLGTANSMASGMSSGPARSEISSSAWSTFTLDPKMLKKDFKMNQSYGVIWVDCRLERGEIAQNSYGAEL